MLNSNTKPQPPKFALGSWVTLLTHTSKPFDESGERFVGMVIATHRTNTLASRGVELLSYTVGVRWPSGSYEEFELFEGQLLEYEEEEDPK
jgi:hypothetical protein